MEKKISRDEILQELYAVVSGLSSYRYIVLGKDEKNEWFFLLSNRDIKLGLLGKYNWVVKRWFMSEDVSVADTKRDLAKCELEAKNLVKITKNTNDSVLLQELSCLSLCGGNSLLSDITTFARLCELQADGWSVKLAENEGMSLVNTNRKVLFCKCNDLDAERIDSYMDWVIKQWLSISRFKMQ